MNRNMEERRRRTVVGSERFETVIIGGGQAGLSVGYHLKKQGRPFVILDANERIGDAWRKRWDSLRLFTLTRYDGLAGWRFPAPAVSFPSKDEMANYLESYAARFDLPVVRFVGHHVLTSRTPLGRKAQPRFISHGAPLVRVKLKDLAAAGVEQVPRTVGVQDSRPALEDGRVLDVSNVIWCTVFREEFSWIDLPIFGENERPLHERGVVVGDPGLYFVGLLFQYAVSSDVLPGVGRDAEHIAKHIASREPNGLPTAHAPAGARRPEALDRARI